MRILFLIQSCIRGPKQNEYLSILQETVGAIRAQSIESGWHIHIVLSDDGSDYLKDVAQNEISLASEETIHQVRQKHALDVDEIVLIGPSDYFNKTDLFDYYLTRFGFEYDLVIFLDDDNKFLNPDALKRFVYHYRRGYNFIVGRLYHPVQGFRSYLDNRVQGTTFALTPGILQAIGFFGKNVKVWGTGDDPELFWKLYLAYQRGLVKGIYDGNIMTIDQISGRWHSAREKAGGISAFEAGFLKIYGVQRGKNPSCHKPGWLDLEPDAQGIDERWFPYIKLDEYLRYHTHRRYFHFLWYRRQLTWNSRLWQKLRQHINRFVGISS